MIKIFDPSQIHLYRPPPDSHKGQNGKLLVIGGSELFHSSIFWAADVASRIVDLVHLTSPANENNQIFRKRLKEKFWSGIVVDWAEVESYIKEDDAVLIGPGMTRDSETEEIVNSLLRRYPTRRWVIDGGGLQEVDVGLITESCILTPHQKELERLKDKINFPEHSEHSEGRISPENQRTGEPETPAFRSSDGPNLRLSEFSECSELSKKLNNCTILLKGPTDIVCQGERCVQIEGGNPGMTKGGTGDVLAGLVAAPYSKNDAWTAATVGSWVNKTAGDNLYKRVGPYFNAADLVEEVPKVLREFSR